MIVIKIEMWRYGNPKDRTLLGEMHIVNKGNHPDSLRRGNYRFNFARPGGKEYHGEVHDFPRKSLSVFSLLKRCLNVVETP